MINIPQEEYKELKKKAEIDDFLLIKLVKGLEDIKEGRIKLWRKAS